MAVRPTQDRVREALMSMLAAELPDARVLDLFAGTGALGLEALSRGAAHATFLEGDRRALRCLRANITALEADADATVVAGDVFDYLARSDGSFDLAFADPPYGHGLAARLLVEWRRRPFAWILCIEHRADEPLELPPLARSRRYGDTAIALIPATESKEDGR